MAPKRRPQEVQHEMLRTYIESSAAGAYQWMTADKKDVYVAQVGPTVLSIARLEASHFRLEARDADVSSPVKRTLLKETQPRGGASAET